MNNAGSSSGCSKFLGNTVLAGIVAIAGLAWAVYTFYQNNRDIQKELDNQAIQIAQQQTQIALVAEQNQLRVQELTLAAEQEGQLLTPVPSDNGNFSLTATAFIVQGTQIEATRQAIATKQRDIELTQTAILLQPQPSGPIPLGRITIPANMNQGIQIPIEETGRYTFRYVSGSYSVFPASQNSHWLTAIFVYKASTPVWIGVDLNQDTDARIADYDYHSSSAAAEAAAQGSTTSMLLEQGEMLILIASDNKYDFADNPGQVVLEWSFMPSK